MQDLKDMDVEKISHPMEESRINVTVLKKSSVHFRQKLVFFLNQSIKSLWYHLPQWKESI